ncbi:TIGR02206 family membrane protein [Nocardioides sp. KR10-350]|uniref:YwaF family protein n=1 Tax=Nocardioides cheoyonin TaxID=3156615 RepID=UPI0032B55C0B
MTPYGVTHLVPLALFAVGLCVVVALGRRHRTMPGPTAFSRGLALALPAVMVPLQIWDFATRFDLQSTLPFHLCDLTWVATAFALWTHRPYPAALTCYWGLVLTPQGIFTPSVEDFPEIWYFGYWALHLMVVWGTVYLVLGLGKVPRWRDYATTVATTLVWAVLAYCFNLVADTNYGYLMHKPDTGSFLDLLGPWPGYVAAEVAIVAAVWALLTVVLRPLGRSRTQARGSTRTPVRS